MKLESRDLLDEFYNLKKQEYPDITQEQMKEVCTSYWEYFKEGVENLDFTSIRFMHLGLFIVYEKRAISLLKHVEEKFSKGKVTQQRYDHIKKRLEDIIKTHGLMKEDKEKMRKKRLENEKVV